MSPEPVIEIRHLIVGERRVPVVLTRTRAGGVAGQCLLEDSERPIIDGASVQDVLQVIQDVLEALLLARAKREQ